jgi:hypothetical protein
VPAERADAVRQRPPARHLVLAASVDRRGRRLARPAALNAHEDPYRDDRPPLRELRTGAAPSRTP